MFIFRASGRGLLSGVLDLSVRQIFSLSLRIFRTGRSIFPPFLVFLLISLIILTMFSRQLLLDISFSLTFSPFLLPWSRHSPSTSALFFLKVIMCEVDSLCLMLDALMFLPEEGARSVRQILWLLGDFIENLMISSVAVIALPFLA